MIVRVGICFSREFSGKEPLSHTGEKLPTYLRLLKFCQKEGWEVYVLTRKTYQGNGLFKGGWLFCGGQFLPIKKAIKVDLVYDRTGGVKFPPSEEVAVVNRRNFKLFCWDKWQAYQTLSEFMPQTFWVGEKGNLASVLPKIKTAWVVLKPFNGLKGIGIFIGSKKEAASFGFLEKYPQYIAQEFIDTSSGVTGITKGLHDLRVAVINGKVTWSHVRVPPRGSFQANVARGGSIKEIDYQRQVPDGVKRIVEQITTRFFKEYDNPIYSLDFGVDKTGKPFIFEINDQIGFPRWEMTARDEFLQELVKNFSSKLKHFEQK